jgi:serine protease Do
MYKNLSVFLSALGGGILALSGYLYFQPVPQTVYITERSAPVQQVREFPRVTMELPDFITAADQTLNSVVHIKTLTRTQAQFVDPFHHFFYGHRQAQPRMQSGSGSGVIIDDRGYIITNNHVIDGAEKIEVILNDKRSYDAKLVGRDRATDIAVLKVEGDGLVPVVVGNSDRLRVGEWVLAIGNPFNLSSTVTAGIVSAKARNIDVIRDNFKIESFIQTDAAVNPGNSGGALVNVRGELVGINTAIASNTGSYAGYAFAIPSNLAHKIAYDIIEFGTPQRGLIGLNVRDIRADIARERNLPFSRGVLVDQPFSGSAADAAGIRAGDVILAIQGSEVMSVSEMQEQLGLYRPGDVVLVKVWRGGKESDIPVTLKNQQGGTDLVSKKDEIIRGLGADFEQVSEAELRRLGVANGLRIKTLRKGKLASLGIRTGYIITEVNGKAIYTLDDLAEAAELSRRFYVGGVYPTGEKVYYSFQ